VLALALATGYDLSAQIILTFAGTGSYGNTGDFGPDTSATLSTPNAVAADAAGNIYMTSANTIRMVDPTGNITTFAGSATTYGYGGDGGPAISAYLYAPTRVATDAAGNVYIADQGNHRIRKVDGTGTITAVAGTGVGGFSGDGGLAIDAKLDFPYGVAVDASGNICIYQTRATSASGK